MSHFFVPIQKADLKWYQDLPFSITYQDIYHAVTNGMEQSRYVFIDGNNLISRWQELEPNALFTVAETGFGMGLNFLLTWQLWMLHAPQSSRLHFISCEKNPLASHDLIKALALWPQLDEQAQQLIANYPILTPGYHNLSFAEGRVTLTLMLGEALECYEQLLVCGESGLERELRTGFVDAWYLDGFAPDKNKSMWSEPLMQTIALLSKQGTTLATYTVAAVVKERLRQQGFTLEKKKGFGPKRHMLTACFNPNTETRLKQRHTPWHLGRPSPYHNKSAIIVGAGLAGCFTAYSLAKKGWDITLIDELDEIGKAASANQRAVLFPKLSAYNSPLTQLMLSAFLYAVRFYQTILSEANLGELYGSLLLAYNQKEQSAQSSVQNWLNHYPDLGMLVDAVQASNLAGVPLQQSGLFIPLSGWIDSPALCQFLVATQGIKVVTGQSVAHLIYERDRWIVHDRETEVLILANGYKINAFAETRYLPVKPIRGQMTIIPTSAQSAHLRIPLCGDGHVLPAHNGFHYLGATYELNTTQAELKHGDDQLNLAKLGRLVPDVSWSDEINDHWSGVRATTTDYLPIVGPIARETEFMSLYAGLASNAKRWIPQTGPYYPGLYACSGFGSRGLTTIPLCAQWLASLINQEFNMLPRNTQQALSPARFLRKKIIRTS